MITATDIMADVLASQAIVPHLRVEVWQGDTLLSDDVPVIDGTEEQDSTLRVPERVTLTVPIEDDGISWVPVEFDSALGVYGQRARVSLGVEVDVGQVEWLNRGWFIVNSVDPQGDTLQVELLGLLALVDEANLPTEFQPRTGALFGDIVRALVEPGVTVNDDAAPTDRVPGGDTVTYSDNRLDSLLSILDAWPAQGVISEDGFLEITPALADPVDGDEVLHLTDGQDGTVVDVATSTSRDGAFNAVVAKGQYPDTDATRAGQEIVATAYDTDPDSPYYIDGPFSPYVVPFTYASPLLSTLAQVQMAATTVLARKRRESSRTVQIQCVPDPRLQQSDVVKVTSTRRGLDGALGRIQALSLPYTAAGGAMSLTVVLGG